MFGPVSHCCILLGSASTALLLLLLLSSFPPLPLLFLRYRDPARHRITSRHRSCSPGRSCPQCPSLPWSSLQQRRCVPADAGPGSARSVSRWVLARRRTGEKRGGAVHESCSICCAETRARTHAHTHAPVLLLTLTTNTNRVHDGGMAINMIQSNSGVKQNTWIKPTQARGHDSGANTQLDWLMLLKKVLCGDPFTGFIMYCFKGQGLTVQNEYKYSKMTPTPL